MPNLKSEVRQYLHDWNTLRDGAPHRNKLRRLTEENGYDEIEDFVEAVFTDDVQRQRSRPAKVNGINKHKPVSKSDTSDAFKKVDGRVYELANEMLDSGYTGQGLDNVERAEAFITLAAGDPDCEETMPEAAYGFWRAALFQYTVWKAKQARATRKRDPVDQLGDEDE